MSTFNVRQLIRTVFVPESDETVTVMVDHPVEGIDDNPAWQERRQMAAEWHEAFAALGTEIGFRLNPIFRFPATGDHNAPFPAWGWLGQDKVAMETVLGQTTLAVALTEFSASAPLSIFASQHADFRAASMPKVARRMERTALSADYNQIAETAHLLAERLAHAVGARLTFNSGDILYFDLRYRHPEVDAGELPRHKEGMRVINLPSGEAFIAPYEGERHGEPSLTAGTVPVLRHGERMHWEIEENRIVAIAGSGSEAAKMRAYFDADPARTNIAELGLGCNNKAVVWGNVLEDEKAGVHWAYGRSDHIGGVVGVADFRSPATVVHEDIVYAKDSPIQATTLRLFYRDGSEEDILVDGVYKL